VLAEMMKSDSNSLTVPSSFTFLFYFPLDDLLKVIANRCSENASLTSQTIDLSKVTWSGRHTVYCVLWEKPANV